MWKGLPPDQRAYWDEVATKDKHRYMAEKAMYTGPWQVPWKRAKKDPSAPKRPMSAFLYFSQDKRREIKAKNPHMKNTEVSRVLGEMWRNATEEERRPHVEREKKERDQYKDDISKWRDEHNAKLEAQRKAQADQAQFMAQNGMLNPQTEYQSFPVPPPQPYGDTGIMAYPIQGDNNIQFNPSFQGQPESHIPDPSNFDSNAMYGQSYPPATPNNSFANGKQMVVLGPSGMPQFPMSFNPHQQRLYPMPYPQPEGPDPDLSQHRGPDSYSFPPDPKDGSE
eukprot:CAMPEP_0118714724 /NCGR_PEP_ID=MMETSP0800-20121206/26383_1 /TAXON_ID=210618 ORGANISM="Striatella unipunctata, Strain CCMP2910" /NCGR_SAMPLE_ID=MMETSP0800 /ASSEMBLY_ACC=CAM_ASM_000638 /LENGTH=279 /DNA_ID=CAMNT_0006620623 /DNA_START=179 /DNA_END=1018 /DNA_ORIENTATION=-